jgi:hypothetical protein
MCASQIGAIVLTSLSNAVAFFFGLSHRRRGNERRREQGGGGSCDKSTLVHGKSPKECQ